MAETRTSVLVVFAAVHRRLEKLGQAWEKYLEQRDSNDTLNLRILEGALIECFGVPEQEFADLFKIEEEQCRTNHDNS